MAANAAITLWNSKMDRLSVSAGSIPHIDDLDINTYLQCLQDLASMQCTAKLDGSNLSFGLDESGNFYTSRESKSGGKDSRKYKASEYDSNTGAGVTFRNAHSVLEQKLTEIKQCLSNGDSVDVEVLFGRQPNTIVYGKDNSSYVCLLQPTDSSAYDRFKLLESKIANSTVDITEYSIVSEDGFTTTTKQSPGRWVIGTADYVDSTKFANDETLKSLVAEMADYLKTYNNHAEGILNKKITNGDILSKFNSSFPKGTRDGMLLIRSGIKNAVNAMKKNIKDHLIAEYNNKIVPKYQDTTIPPSEQIGVEGLVFTPKDSRVFKVVDTETFTAINKFYYSERNKIYGLIKTTDESKDLELRGGIYGDMIIAICKYLGDEKLARPASATAYFKSIKQDNIYTTVDKLVVKLRDSKHLNNDNFANDIYNIIAKFVITLDDSLKSFKSGYNSYELHLPSGKTVKYNKAIVDRTLLQYAQCFGKMESMLEKTKTAESMHDILIHIFSGSLNKLF